MATTASQAGYLRSWEMRFARERYYPRGLIIVDGFIPRIISLRPLWEGFSTRSITLNVDMSRIYQFFRKPSPPRGDLKVSYSVLR